MLNPSSATRVWKHKIPCVTCHCYSPGFGCSLHSLLSKEGKPSSQLRLVCTSPGQHHLLFFRFRTPVLRMNLPGICSEVKVSSMEKKVVTSILCLPRPCQGQTTFADGSCPQEQQLGKSKSISLSPGTTSSPIPSKQPSSSQQRNEMLSVISVSQMGNGKMKCSSLLQTDLSVISSATKHKPAFV